MEIEKIPDIIVPAKSILASTGWEEEISPIIKGYAEYWGDDFVTGTSSTEIDKCEKRLGTTLPEDLKLFYLKFGAAKLSETLMSVDEFFYLAASMDKSHMDMYSKDEQKMIAGLVVFGDYLGNGNLWCFEKDSKKIFYFKHDAKPNIHGMFDHFYDYLQLLLIYTQGEMGQHVDGLEKEVEQMVVDKIGRDKVKVWRYYSGWN